MIRLRILGSPDLRGYDRQAVLSVVSQPQRLTLLSYLAMTSHGTFTPRERLILLFWPDSDPDRGRASLRTALYGLRKSLGPRVLTSRGDDEVGIDADELSCDALDFERAVKSGDFDAAWDLYGGPLLEHVSAPDAPGLERWLEDQRTRLRRKAVELAIGLSERSERGDDLRTAVRWAEEAQSLEPLSESGIRRVIRLLDQLSDRAGAVQAYDEFAERLAKELDLEPAAETTGLITSLRTTDRVRPEPADHGEVLPRAAEGESDRGFEPAAAGPTRPPPAVESGESEQGTPRSRFAALTVVLIVTVLGLFLWGTTRGGGAIGQGERVILSDFTDSSGEGLGRVVTEALRIDLLQSSVIDLVEAPEIERTLALMRAAESSDLTAERAREVAIRDGIAAVIDGEVARAGTGYVITTSLREPEGGRSLASLRVTASGPDDVIASIDRLSEALREEAGESLRQIRGGRPLEQVTTHSLEALKLYTEAAEVMYRQREGRAPPDVLRESLALDPEFAMAWRLLGVSLPDDPVGRAEGHANAFRYRQRLPDRERYLVEGTYYSSISLDVPRAVEAYRNVLRIDPGDPAALNNLANRLRGSLNDLDGAEELQRRAVASPRRGVLHYSMLLRNLVHQGRVDEAASVLGDWQAAFPDASPAQSFLILLVRGDLTEAARYAQARSDDPSRGPADRARSAIDLARVSYWRGQLNEARRHLLRAEDISNQGRVRPRWETRRDAAYEEGLVGDPAWARTHLRQALAGVYRDLPVTAGHHPIAAMRFAAAGDFEAAERIVSDWQEGKPDELKGPTEIASMALASLQVAVSRGDTVGAVETMHRLLVESGCSTACQPFFQASLHDQLEDHERAAELYEIVLRPGYFAWGRNTGERLHAMLRLGPLYEAVDDTTKAIAAYRRMADQWADGDERGLEFVARARERISALGG